MNMGNYKSLYKAIMSQIDTKVGYGSQISKPYQETSSHNNNLAFYGAINRMFGLVPVILFRLASYKLKYDYNSKFPKLLLSLFGNNKLQMFLYFVFTLSFLDITIKKIQTEIKKSDVVESDQNKFETITANASEISAELIFPAISLAFFSFAFITSKLNIKSPIANGILFAALFVRSALCISLLSNEGLNTASEGFNSAKMNENRNKKLIEKLELPTDIVKSYFEIFFVVSMLGKFFASSSDIKSNAKYSILLLAVSKIIDTFFYNNMFSKGKLASTKKHPKIYARNTISIAAMNPINPRGAVKSAVSFSAFISKKIYEGITNKTGFIG